MVTSFVEEVKSALSAWLKDKDDDSWTKRTGMESEILPTVAERTGDAWDNLRSTKHYKATLSKVTGDLRKQLSKESADAYRERVRQGRESGHPRPELQFTDLERRENFNIDEFRAGIEAQYNHQASAYYSTARLWDDGIIDPKKTREVLGLSFYIAARDMGTKSNFGVFRM